MRTKKKKNFNEKGITLIALVITVIVVLIFYDNLFSGLNL